MPVSTKQFAERLTKFIIEHKLSLLYGDRFMAYDPHGFDLANESQLNQKG